MIMRNFQRGFKHLLDKLNKHEPFAFTRFSDGELYILQNRTVIIENNSCVVREQSHAVCWGDEELKAFIPEKDIALNQHLTKAFLHKQPNYFKGLCTKGDVGGVDWDWQFADGRLDRDDDHLTFANLLINGNYKKFMDVMIPEIRMAKHKVIYVCNKLADLTNFPLDLVKDFRIGQNCHINDVHLIDEMKEWIQTNDISDHLFLFSAASLTNLLIYELYKDFPNNTYMDVGSTLNPMLGLYGWKASRGYLRGYWLGETQDHYYNQIGIWED